MRLMVSARELRPRLAASQFEKSLVRNCSRRREVTKWKWKLAWLMEGTPVLNSSRLDAVGERGEEGGEVGGEGGDGGIVGNIEGGELFGEGIAIGFGEGPLGEVIGETFGEKVMGAEGLEGVVKDRGITALFQAREEFLQISRRLIADAGEIGTPHGPGTVQ